MTPIRKIAFATLAAPLALGLAACGSNGGDDGVTSGEPIAPIAAPEGTEWTETVTVSEADGYILGNPDAPIKLVEYASLTCGACAYFVTNGLEPLKNEYIASGRVSLELRNLIRDPIDLTVATLARCGDNNGAFFPRSDAWWQNFDANMQTVQQNGAAIESALQLPGEQRLVRLAEATGIIEQFAALGLPRDQATQCLADEASYTKIADQSQANAADQNVTATPTFFINGNRVEGTQWEPLQVALQQAGAR